MFLEEVAERAQTGSDHESVRNHGNHGFMPVSPVQVETTQQKQSDPQSVSMFHHNEETIYFRQTGFRMSETPDVVSPPPPRPRPINAASWLPCLLPALVSSSVVRLLWPPSAVLLVNIRKYKVNMNQSYMFTSKVEVKVHQQEEHSVTVMHCYRSSRGGKQTQAPFF